MGTGNEKCRFVGMNLVLDLLPVRTGIGPCIGQICSPQGGIAPQEVGFTGAQTLCLDEDPNGYTRADNTWLSPTDVWSALNPGKRVPKIADDPLEDLRFFCTGQCRQELLNFLQCMHNFVSVPRLQVPVVEQVYIPSTLWWEVTTRMDAEHSIRRHPVVEHSRQWVLTTMCRRTSFWQEL
jgi:hypothetical protein